MTTAESYTSLLMALCIWREARGQSREVKTAVKHVILNRAANPTGPYAKCHDVVSVILCPYQFSSFNRSDANAALMPNPKVTGDWNAWLECCAVVDAETQDPTSGANYYFDLSIKPPDWADPVRQTAQIGAMRFFRI
jgi:N-acetylmuramoyl-L-alanine amidase